MTSEPMLYGCQRLAADLKLSELSDRRLRNLPFAPNLCSSNWLHS